MRTKIYNDVKMFRTSELSKYNNGQFGTIFEEHYTLEVKGDKGRVYSDNPWIHKPSDWRKVKLIKKLKNTNKAIFRLKVNGMHTFFKVALHLPN
jgi:hypothetical protein